VVFKLNPYIGFELKLQPPTDAPYVDGAIEGRLCPGRDADAAYQIYYGMDMLFEIKDLATPKFVIGPITIPSITLISGTIFEMGPLEILAKDTIPRSICLYCVGCLGCPREVSRKISGYKANLAMLDKKGPYRDMFVSGFLNDISSLMNAQATVVSADAARRGGRRNDKDDVIKVFNTSTDLIEVEGIEADEQMSVKNFAVEGQPITVQFKMKENQEGVDMRKMGDMFDDMMLKGMIGYWTVVHPMGKCPIFESWLWEDVFVLPGQAQMPAYTPWPLSWPALMLWTFLIWLVIYIYLYHRHDIVAWFVAIWDYIMRCMQWWIDLYFPDKLCCQMLNPDDPWGELDPDDPCNKGPYGCASCGLLYLHEGDHYIVKEEPEIDYQPYHDKIEALKEAIERKNGNFPSYDDSFLTSFQGRFHTTPAGLEEDWQGGCVSDEPNLDEVKPRQKPSPNTQEQDLPAKTSKFAGFKNKALNLIKTQKADEENISEVEVHAEIKVKDSLMSHFATRHKKAVPEDGVEMEVKGEVAVKDEDDAPDADIKVKFAAMKAKAKADKVQAASPPVETDGASTPLAEEAVDEA